MADMALVCVASLRGAMDPWVLSPTLHWTRAKVSEDIWNTKRTTATGGCCFLLVFRATLPCMGRYDFNLVVIGGGPAGEKGAAQVAYFGLPDSVIPESCGARTHDDFRVALVERQPFLGGACINTGTLPSKTLRESALF